MHVKIPIKQEIQVAFYSRLGAKAVEGVEQKVHFNFLATKIVTPPEKKNRIIDNSKICFKTRSRSNQKILNLVLTFLV